MKFCDERIQRHLLNGGKITHSDLHYPIFLRVGSKIYYSKEKNREYMKLHRRYKQEIYLKEKNNEIL